MPPKSQPSRQQNGSPHRSADSENEGEPSETAAGNLGDRSVNSSCGQCTGQVGQKSGLQCHACHRWYHSKKACSGLDDNEYKFTCGRENRHLPYHCHRCSETNLTNADQLQTLIQTVQNLVARLTDMEARFQTLAQSPPPPIPTPPPHPASTSQLQPASFNQQPSLQPPLQRLVDLRTFEHEIAERQARRQNLIINGLQPSKDDLAAAKEVLKFAANADVEIESVKRLSRRERNAGTDVTDATGATVATDATVAAGATDATGATNAPGATNSTRPPPLLVVLRDAKSKGAVFKGVKKLRESDRYKRVYVDNDYTKSERDALFTLRQQLRANVQQGNRSLRIDYRAFRLVPKNPPRTAD